MGIVIRDSKIRKKHTDGTFSDVFEIDSSGNVMLAQGKKFLSMVDANTTRDIIATDGTIQVSQGTSNYLDLTNRPTALSQFTNDLGNYGNWITTSALSGYATETYVTTTISNLVDSAPATLDTLNELAAALGDDANFSTTVTTSIGTKLPLAGGVMSGNIGRSSAIVGFLEGSYNNVGGNSTNTNPIYTIGSNYNPASTTLSNMYGVGYSNVAASFITLTGASDWGFYVAADGDARVWLDGSTGNISGAGNVYASGGNSTEWNTAYGWGHHADYGYLTSLPSHNHDDRYYTESESDGRFQPIENQRLSTSNDATFSQVYSNNWFRNNSINTGLYQQAGGGNHWYAEDSNIWTIAANGSYPQIRFRSGGHQGAIRGYVYADTSNYIGFLSEDGNWALRTWNRGVEAYGSMRAPIFYDSDDTNYYGDFASTSRFKRLLIQQPDANSAAGPALRVSKGWDNGTPDILYDTVVIESNDVTSIRMKESDGGTAGWSTGDGYTSFTANTPMRFYTAGSTSSYVYSGMGGTLAMYIDQSQKIGMGTAAPTSRLHVVGNSTGSDVLAVDGLNGRLFTVKDDLSDSLFAVNTVAGLPVMEVSADNSIVLGKFGVSDPGTTYANGTIKVKAKENDYGISIIGDYMAGISFYANKDDEYYTSQDARFGWVGIYQGNLWFQSAAPATYSAPQHYFAGPVYASIIYDSDNTGYYGDFASTSVLNQMTANYIGVGQAVNTSYRIITSGDYYANAGGNYWAEGRFKQYRGSGTWHDVIDSGNIGDQSVNYAASAGSVAASGITGQTGMWTSATRPGAYRLYRNDDDSAYNVQTTWSSDVSGYWSLRGYSADSYHAPCYVALAGSANSVAWTNVSDRPTAVSSFTNDAGYITSAGSVSSATTATQVVTIQDSAPSGAAGKLWWESDTGKLKVYYGSAWVDASPNPDMSIYYTKAGGAITGEVTIQQTLTVVGNVLIEGTLTETSDITLKENITPLQDSLNKISKLNGVTFNKKTTPELKEIGFIAQEVEEVLPELVTETEEGIKTVAYSRVTAVLVETIKEQQAQIDELKELVSKLAEKLNSL
jgi:hypothetical protein